MAIHTHISEFHTLVHLEPRSFFSHVTQTRNIFDERLVWHDLLQKARSTIMVLLRVK